MVYHDKILYFDGVCNLCNALVRFIIKRDHRLKIKFSPLQSVEADKVMKSKNFSDDSVVYYTGNQYYIKSSAILKLLGDLGGVWRIFSILKIIPVRIRDYIYDMIAKNRYRIFGRSDTCMIPSEETRERFII